MFDNFIVSPAKLHINKVFSKGCVKINIGMEDSVYISPLAGHPTHSFASPTWRRTRSSSTPSWQRRAGSWAIAM